MSPPPPPPSSPRPSGTPGSLLRRRRANPVHARGRLGRFVGGLRDYLGTAWWGLVTPRVTESEPLVIVQAAIFRGGESSTQGEGAEVESAAPLEVLLSVRSDLFGWELPGGTPESGETLEESVRREVLEETGLEIEIEAVVGDWVRRGFRPHTARIFRGRVVSGVETPSHETPRVAWFDVKHVPEALFPWYRDPLACALRPDEAPVQREEWQGIATILSTMKIDLGMRWRGLPRSED